MARQLSLWENTIVEQLAKGATEEDIADSLGLPLEEVNYLASKQSETIITKTKYYKDRHSKTLDTITNNYENDLAEIYAERHVELNNRLIQSNKLLPKINKIILEIIDEYESEGEHISSYDKPLKTLKLLSDLSNNNSAVIDKLVNQLYSIETVLTYIKKEGSSGHDN